MVHILTISCSVAGGDQVLFHATLALSAFDLENLQGDDGESRSKLILNKECIRLLRERVADPVLGINDQSKLYIFHL